MKDKVVDKVIKDVIQCPPNYILIGSSMLFLFPSLYAYYKKKTFLSFVSLCNTVFSAYYWMNPVPGFSRNADLVLSKMGGVIYFAHGYYNIHSTLHRLIGYSNLVFLLKFYCLSCETYSKNTYKWIFYHVGFHICTCIGKMIVLL